VSSQVSPETQLRQTIDSSWVLQIHAHVFRQLEARGIPYSVKQTYDSGVFTGASVQLSSEEVWKDP
jgi:hypothetical protein